MSGCGPVGRAPDLGSGCREFESPHSDQVRIIRTQSSKLEMCSDFLFLLIKFFNTEPITANQEHPDRPLFCAIFRPASTGILGE